MTSTGIMITAAGDLLKDKKDLEELFKTNEPVEGYSSYIPNNRLLNYYQKNFKMQRTMPTHVLNSDKYLSLFNPDETPYEIVDVSAASKKQRIQNEPRFDIMYRPYPTVYDLKLFIAHLVFDLTRPQIQQ